MTIGANGRQLRTSEKKHRTRVSYGQALSKREIEVLSRACSMDEPTGDRVATDLGISEGTVRLHMTRIYRKLGVHTKLAAYRKATELLKIELKDWQ